MNLDPLFSDDQRMIADSAKRFAEKHGGPARLRTLRSMQEGYDSEGLRAAVEAGWISLLVSEQAGGSGLGPGSLCLIAEALGGQLCAMPLAPAAATALAMSVSASPSHKPLLDGLMHGEHLILPALQCGRNRFALKQTADGGWAVSGRCDGIPAASADGFVIEASGKAGHIVFHMPAKVPGLKLKPARGVDGSALSCLNLRNLQVPADALIASGDAARALAGKMNQVIQLAIASEMLGLMDGALKIVLEYLGTRVQFGQPIGKFQALRHQSVDNYAQKETVRALVFEAARSADMNGAESGQLAIAARVLAGEASLAITKSSIQLHGAIGFTDEHNIGLFLKRAMALAAQYGPTGALRRQYRENLKKHADGNWPGLPRVGTENEEDARFRAETRTWLEANLPASYRNVPTRLNYANTMDWHRRLYAGGLVAPGWPTQYGGMGATLSRQVILADELARVGAPEISGQAINHIGPILQRFGTPAQKEQHLDAMLRGNKVWCQGYSEPNAGSDLASLRTKAAVMGDHIIVNGQKIWTTWAHNADWIFALVRTNPDAPRKQEGISFILIDMKSPGITRRAIQTIAGDDELATVFFDDVKVPIENVVGEINGGWKIANALLVNERLGSAGTQRNIVTLHHIWRLAAASGLVEDEAFLDRLAGAEIELTAIASAYAQAVSMLDRGQVGAESSFIKIAGTALLHRLSDMLFEASCALGGGQGTVKLHDLNISPAISFLQNRRATIYGGTQEIQKDIVAKRVLNLP